MIATIIVTPFTTVFFLAFRLANITQLYQFDYRTH